MLAFVNSPILIYLYWKDTSMNPTEKNFKKFLLEMSGPARTLLHFTNTSALAGIFKDGGLKLSDYDVNIHTEKKIQQGSNEPSKVSELATVRPSLSHKQLLPDLSSNIGLVKLKIRTDILSDKVRHVKIRPIAEFPLDSINNIRNEFIKIGNSKNQATQNAHRVLAAFKRITNNEKKEEEQNKDFEDYLKKAFHVDLPIKLFIQAGENMMFYLQNREGEERVSLKKGEFIPLNSSYISIELMPGFTEDFDEGYLRQTNYTGQEILQVAQWKKYLEKYQNYFEKNSELYKFKNKLRALSREYGNRVASSTPAKQTIKTIKPLTKNKRKLPEADKKIIMPKWKNL
jgi:hypothetical protein